jgi:hypothetical protein
LVVATALVVVAVGAVTQIGPASGPDRRTVDRSFAVLAAPIVVQSNASGSALNALLTDGPTLERTTFFSDLAALTTATAEDEQDFAALSPPVPTGDVVGRCGATMTGRQRAASDVRDALEHLLGGQRGRGGGDEATAARTLVSAGVMLRSADASWATCRRTLERGPGSARLPVSVWMTHPGLWGQAALGPLVAALVSSASLAPVHQLSVLAVSTDPATVPEATGVSVLPPTRNLHVRVVLANQGNVDEQGVVLEVTAVAQGSARAPARVRITTDIGVGDSVALLPPALSIRPGTSYVLDITATPQAPGGSISTSVTLRVAVVPPTTTTTTTTVPPTTTRAPKNKSTTPKTTSTTAHSG